MQFSRFEKWVIASPIAIHFILPLALIQVDVFLDTTTKSILFALFALVFYPIFPGSSLKSRSSLISYLIVHLLTAWIAIYVIYNDSALIYLYASLIVFALTVSFSMIFRKISSRR